MKKSFISTDSDNNISPENNISLKVLDSINNIYKIFTSDIIPEERKNKYKKDSKTKKTLGDISFFVDCDAEPENVDTRNSTISLIKLF